MDNSIKIVLMVILSIFALISAGGGFWCLYQNQALHSENYGWGAFVCLLVTLGLLSGVAKVAGVNLNF